MIVSISKTAHYAASNCHSNGVQNKSRDDSFLHQKPLATYGNDGWSRESRRNEEVAKTSMVKRIWGH